MRPVMVRHMEDTTPVLILKLVSRMWTDKRVEDVTARHETQRGYANRMGTCSLDEYVPAARGEWVPMAQWLADTADGCVQCGADLMADEADDLHWVEGGSRPMRPAVCSIT